MCQHQSMSPVVWRLMMPFPELLNSHKVCPHRFGGEGVLIGVQTATLNSQVTFVNIAVAVISFSWGGLLEFSHRNPSSAGVFVFFGTIFGRWIWRGYWDGILGRFGGGSGNGKTDLEGFRQRKNGQQWKNNCKYRCFQRIWDVRVLNTLQNQCFGPTLYWRTRKLSEGLLLLRILILGKAATLEIMLFLKKRLKQHCKNLCFGPTLCLFMPKHV